MPVDVPTEDYLSLNQAARFSGVEQQEFRKLVREFERQAGKLPTRINNEDKESKFIPMAFVHVFEQAAMWMRVQETTAADGMALALQTKRSGALEQLAASVKDREPLLRLPNELRRETLALKQAAGLVRPVNVTIRDMKEVTAERAELRKEARLNWWVVLAVAVSCLLLGALAASWRTDAQLAALRVQVNNAQFTLTREIHHLETLKRR